MGPMETWEMLLVGAIVVLVLLWMRPGLRSAFKQTEQATEKDWQSVLIPLILVVLFVILLISLVR